VWIAVCSYLLVVIIRKRLNLPLNLYTVLQILSALFEKVPINQAFSLGNSRQTKTIFLNNCNCSTFNLDTSAKHQVPSIKHQAPPLTTNHHH